MGIVIMGPTDADIPLEAVVPQIYIKENYADDWLFEPSLEFMRAGTAVGSEGIGACSFLHRYGSIEREYETSYSTQDSKNIDNWWLRIVLVSEHVHQTTLITEMQTYQDEIWVGRINAETRDVYGDDTAKTGIQRWVAYEPIDMLRKKHISTSYWLDGSTEKEIGWVPSMNKRDSLGRLVGNRSAAQYGGAYLYGGINLWTRYEYLEYILAKFADESDNSGPKWKLSGQADLLRDISDVIELSATQSVLDIIRMIINPRYGVDFKVMPYVDGFEIFVFSLVADDYNYEGASLPKNPNILNIVSSETIDMEDVSITETSAHKYGKIRIIGDRIIVCCSLHASKEELTPNWTGTLEDEYKEGTGTGGDDAQDHDAARKLDKYRTVYQSYGARSSWYKAAPALDQKGEVDESGATPEYQKTVRRTLSWLPLLEGYDYTAKPAYNNNYEGVIPDYQKPMAWVYDPDWPRYFPVEDVRISLYVPNNDWGVFLDASPNHLLALNWWGGANATTQDPWYDREMLVATIAIETDQRLQITHRLTGVDDGSVLDIHIPGAQLWYLEQATVVGLDLEGALAYADSRVLRNDAPYLWLVMAGAIARYYMSRARATVRLGRLVPWGGLLGHILTLIEDKGDSHNFQSAVTAVEWDASGDTTIKTGYAQ